MNAPSIIGRTSTIVTIVISRLREHRPYYIGGEGEKSAPGGSPDDFLKINHQTRANPPVRSRRRQRVHAHLRLRPAPP